MTTVPTPSDSQDGARRRDDASHGSGTAVEQDGRPEQDQPTIPSRRRDDACPIGYHGDPLGCDDRCYPTPRQRRTRPGGPLQHDGPPTAYENRLDELKRERDEARATVARLEAERDEARAAAGRMRQARNEAQAQCRAFGPLVEAVLRFAEVESGRTPTMENSSVWLEELNVRRTALLAAVDQTAPSSPLETPHTADGGEAGVVEGAGGSEAAEGRFVMPPCEVCGGEVWEKSAEAVDRIVNDGRLQLVEVTVKPCGHEWYYDRQEASTDG